MIRNYTNTTPIPVTEHFFTLNHTTDVVSMPKIVFLCPQIGVKSSRYSTIDDRDIFMDGMQGRMTHLFAICPTCLKASGLN